MLQRRYFACLIKMNVSSLPLRCASISPYDKPRVSLALSVTASSAILLQMNALPWQLLGGSSNDVCTSNGCHVDGPLFQCKRAAAQSWMIWFSAVRKPEEWFPKYKQNSVENRHFQSSVTKTISSFVSLTFSAHCVTTCGYTCCVFWPPVATLLQQKKLKIL